MGVVSPLDHLPDRGDARRTQELTQLGELLLASVGNHRDQEGALPGPSAGPLPVQRRPGWLAARLTVSLHQS